VVETKNPEKSSQLLMGQMVQMMLGEKVIEDSVPKV